MPSPVFACKRCGACCQGEGGVYLEKEQAAAAAGILGMDQEAFLAKFCRPKDGRYAVICNSEGECALLGPGGCLIQEAKPEVCRRWPYFEALLTVPGALEEAKLACPGINPKVSRQEFAAFYHQYLRANPQPLRHPVSGKKAR